MHLAWKGKEHTSDVKLVEYRWHFEVPPRSQPHYLFRNKRRPSWRHKKASEHQSFFSRCKGNIMTRWCVIFEGWVDPTHYRHQSRRCLWYQERIRIVSDLKLNLLLKVIEEHSPLWSLLYIKKLKFNVPSRWSIKMQSRKRRSVILCSNWHKYRKCWKEKSTF